MLGRLDNRVRAYLGMALGAVAFLAANVFSHEAFNGFRLDLTERALFTISESTKRTVRSIDEPILLRLFFSKALGERNPDYAVHFERVHGLLKQYVTLSRGKIRLELHDPKPFTVAEDRAIAFSLQGVPVNAAGDPAYFGLAGVNSTDDQAAVPFFALEREAFLEYDLTKIVHTLVNPKKKVIGVISTFPVHGRHAPPYGTTPRWPIMEQLDSNFDIMPLETEAREIPRGVDILLIIQPRRLPLQTLYVIEQFVLGGGRALIFADPYAEAQTITALTGQERGRGDINQLLSKWGVVLVPGQLAGDLDAARRVNIPIEGRVQVIDYVVWLSLTEKNFDRRDVATGEMSRINLATPGILELVQGPKTDVKPIMSTGKRSMRIDARKVARADPDAVGMFRDFKPSNKAITLAARITGPVETTFPKGPPPGLNVGEHLDRSRIPINVVVVADADMLHEKFWADRRMQQGNPVWVPFANNADFLVNTLDNLAGGEALIELRARRESSRPFHLVNEIRRASERRYRAKEKALMGRIQQTQVQLEALVGREQARTGSEVLSSKERKKIEGLRAGVVAMRQELRGVQYSLRADIERLDGWLKFLNIGAMPLVLGVLTLFLLFLRRLGRRVA